MWKLIGLVVGILLIPFLYALAYEAYVFVTTSADFDSLQWFIYGFLAFVVLALLVGSGMAFWQIFEHELGHTAMALLFLKSPKKFEVDVAKGGIAGYENGNNFLITLAPYFLPLLTIPLLVVKLLAPPPTYKFLDFLIGFTYAFHLFGLFKEFRPGQPDIKKVGLVFSTVVVAILNVLFFVLIICGVLDDYSYFPTYLKNSLSRAIESYKSILLWLKEQKLSQVDQLPF